jgi:uncharacterized protein YecE (DUF72 family)
MKRTDDAGDQLPGTPDSLRHIPVQLPPSMSRLYSVAAGLSNWTPEEEAWLIRNPRWSEYEFQMRMTVQAIRNGGSQEAVDALEPAMADVLRYDI